VAQPAQPGPVIGGVRFSILLIWSATRGRNHWPLREATVAQRCEQIRSTAVELSSKRR
jgi:hypothetical protein